MAQRFIEESESGLEIMFGIVFWTFYLVVIVPLLFVWDLFRQRRDRNAGRHARLSEPEKPQAFWSDRA